MWEHRLRVVAPHECEIGTVVGYGAFKVAHCAKLDGTCVVALTGLGARRGAGTEG